MKKQLIIFFVIINFTLACSKKLPEINNVNLVLAISPETKQSIGDEQNQFSIIASQRFSNDILNDVIVDVYSSEAQKILKSLSLNQVFSPSVNVIVPANSSASKSSLILGYPFGLLNQQAVFGGVITGVSNKEDENLGGLKMSDLTPVHVVSVVDAKTNQLVFIGCEENCSESSVQNILLQIPILGIDPVAGLIYLDMSTLGSQLDIVQKMDPTGKDTGLSHKSSNLVLFDFSLNTLVFDVASVMSIANPEGDTGKVPSEVTITTRWYLKLFSGFNPAFQSREHIKEVGFFTTLRSAKPLITRFSSTNYHSSAIAKYYIKN
ncbi:MAG: hypothetical protein Q7U04_03440, partial [Bacteriovorax sp.]|nr:hypothetical protein [Bacteriovorax sp.]